MLLDPTFTWTSRLGPRRDDDVALSRVEDDRVTPVLRMSRSRYVLLEVHGAPYPTCDRPGGTLRWRLVGRDALGNQRTATDSLRNVARAECERLRRLDVERARAEARRKAERERRRREEDRRRREESRRLEREHVERFKRQCNALAGRLVTYYHSNRNECRCYLPSGGYLVI